MDLISSFRMDGRVAVVTGASIGLGARFAQVLTAAGVTGSAIVVDGGFLAM
jgi:NADP-dependent 3-hydroxy acid dehydrogenase YdfG